MEEAARDVTAQLAFVRAWVERHRPENGEQWYVADHVVDCDADALWAAVGEALRTWSTIRWTAELADRGFERAVDACVCGHGRLDHGRSTVDTNRSCFRCGCWAFTSPVTPAYAPTPPVSPLRDTGSEVDTARGDAP